MTWCAASHILRRRMAVLRNPVESTSVIGLACILYSAKRPNSGAFRERLIVNYFQTRVLVGLCSCKGLPPVELGLRECFCFSSMRHEDMFRM